MAVKTYSLKTQGGVRLSENFLVREFACKDGTDTILIDDQLVALLQKIRSHFGVPVTIGSGYRTKAYNTKIGGDPYSNHMYGKAADIDVGKGDTAVNALRVAMYCEAAGIMRIGCYIYADGRSWVHVGSSTTKKFWRQNQAGGPQTRVDTFLTVCKRQEAPADVEAVRILQPLLAAMGHYKAAIDGKFGPKTEAAVKAFQRAHGLAVDGSCGPKTWKQLLLLS